MTQSVPGAAPAENMVQRVLAAVSCTPSNAAQIASRCGLSRAATSQRLLSLVNNGRIQRVGYGLFTVNGPEAPQPTPPQAVTRPQPVRDQILAFLTEPRQAFEVAVHTGRRTATITGHMRAMLKLNVVERVGYGRYARAGTGAAPPSAQALARPHPLCEQILIFLDQPRNVKEIAAHLQRSIALVRDRLRAMAMRDLVSCIQPNVFVRIGVDSPHSASSPEAPTADQTTPLLSLPCQAHELLIHADLQVRCDQACAPGAWQS